MEVFEICQMTQTVIFINTLNFAESVHYKLREKGYKSTIIFSRMSHQERDEFVEKFRKGEVNVVITTNLLARGLDVPEIQLVINFDIPKAKVRGKFVHDAESYLHRLGRAGRFGVQGIALTLFDNDEDEKLFWDTAMYLETRPKPEDLEKPHKLQSLIENINID